MARVIRVGSAVLSRARIEAVDDAARIRRLAEEDAASIRAQAREEGLAHARAEAAAQQVETAQLRARVLEEAEAALVPLVRSIVERMLHTALEEDSTRIVAIVRAQLERVQRAQQVALYVHPSDAGALTPVLPSTIRVIADERLAQGDVILESNLGRVDARIAVQLDALERALTEQHLAAARAGKSR